MVSANAFPFWEKWPIDTAGTHFLERMTPLFDLAKSKGKEVFIGETGWASDGSSSHASPATPANALVRMMMMMQYWSIDTLLTD